MSELASGIYVSQAIPMGLQKYYESLHEQFGDVITTTFIDSLNQSAGEVRRIFFDGGMVTTLGEQLDLSEQIFVSPLIGFGESNSDLQQRLAQDKIVKMTRNASLDLLGSGDIFDRLSSIFLNSKVVFLVPGYANLFHPVLNTPSNFPIEFRAKGAYLGKVGVNSRVKGLTIEPSSPDPYLKWIGARAFKLTLGNFPEIGEILLGNKSSFSHLTGKFMMGMIYDIMIETNALDPALVLGHWGKR